MYIDKIKMNATYLNWAGNKVKITGKTKSGLYTSPDTNIKYYSDGISTAIGNGYDLVSEVKD